MSAQQDALNQQFAQAMDFQVKGQLAAARQIYEDLLRQSPNANNVKHNLGFVLLHQGELRTGEAIIREAVDADPNHPTMQSSRKQVAQQLIQSSYWEFAYSWLLDILHHNPDDQEAIAQINRLAPRDYLAPEMFDPLAQQTLLRYSPRESNTYVYTIDIVGSCNLRCPTCPVGNSVDEQRFHQFMPLDLFEKILEKIKRETPVERPQVWLYSWGEPLLHPQLPEIIRKIHHAGFTSHLSSNLNIEKNLKELIKESPTELKISLSGFSPATYATTHAKGNLLLVKSNLYKLRSYLNQYQANTRVWVCQHLYRSNFHEQDAVQKICEELSFEYRPIQAFYQPLEKLLAIAKTDAQVNSEPILQDLLIHPRAQIAFTKQYQQLDYDCELRFNQTVINADGSVSQCCCQYQTENMLNVQFLDQSRDQIELRKYQNPICAECRHAGLDYAPRSLPTSINPTSI